ncbi:MAG: ABC transporter permease, partial [Pseudomonadota bacterium]
SFVQREASPEQLEYLRSTGSVTKLVTMRAMSRLPNGSDQTLVELKAVDSVYPHYGEFTDVDGNTVEISANQAVAEPVLFERFGIKPGAQIEVGKATFTLVSAIGNEPDKVGDNFGFGPKVLISLEGLEKTGLVQPGSLVRFHYKMKLFDTSVQNVAAVTQTARERFPEAGWRIRSRDNAAPALTRSVERFSQFLTLVGLTSLVVGGVGVANATRAFLETKRPVIATLKSVGASGRFVFRLYLIQILIMAVLGIFFGLLLAHGMPYAARGALGTILPVSEGSLFFPQALGLGAFYGLLTALIFAIWPLAVSQDVKPTELFRASSFGTSKSLPRLFHMAVLAGLVTLLVGSTIYFSENRFVSIVFIAAIAFSFVLLRVVASLIQWLAKRAPHSSSTPIRMAVANIHRPGSLTPSVILSLGLGLALLVALATIDGNLRSQIANNLPNDAPDFFFVDIQNHEIDDFRQSLSARDPGGKIISVPMLRGRVVSLRGIASSEYPVEGNGEWVLQGDRGITYAKNIPENSTLTDGEWWESDYSGPPLVSVSAEEAGELNLSVGDEVVVNVLGRNITATISSLREVQWETLGINFVFVFSPNTFAGAPHAFLATLTASESVPKEFDGQLLRELAKTFPTVAAVRIRDALETVNGLIGQLSTAIRAAALVALMSSVLVLAGALAAGNRERVHDAVVLKTLGANRLTLMKTLVCEYTILGFATAIFALVAGTLAAWFVISVIMDFVFVFLPTLGTATILISLALTIVLGLAGTWRILGLKAAPYLREL